MGEGQMAGRGGPAEAQRRRIGLKQVGSSSFREAFSRDHDLPSERLLWDYKLVAGSGSLPCSQRQIVFLAMVGVSSSIKFQPVKTIVTILGLPLSRFSPDTRVVPIFRQRFLAVGNANGIALVVLQKE
jgi:hypothetical protein